ncbi:MAG: hypothetical protein ACPIOQ_76695, partial [Promethearchaeia archaeon]
MAAKIASAPSSWYENYTSLGPVAPGILPFKNIKVALIDMHHNIVFVDMNALFLEKRPGHVYFGEIARIAHAGYSVIMELYNQKKFGQIQEMKTAMTPFFSSAALDRTPFVLPDSLVSSLRWLPNNVIWIDNNKQGSNHYDTTFFGLLYTVYQVIMSLCGESAAPIVSKMMQQPVLFTPAMKEKFGAFAQDKWRRNTATKTRALEFTATFIANGVRLMPSFEPRSKPGQAPAINVTVQANVLPYLASPPPSWTPEMGLAKPSGDSVSAGPADAPSLDLILTKFTGDHPSPETE